MESWAAMTDARAVLVSFSIRDARAAGQSQKDIRQKKSFMSMLIPRIPLLVGAQRMINKALSLDPLP